VTATVSEGLKAPNQQQRRRRRKKPPAVLLVASLSLSSALKTRQEQKALDARKGKNNNENVERDDEGDETRKIQTISSDVSVKQSSEDGGLVSPMQGGGSSRGAESVLKLAPRADDKYKNGDCNNNDDDDDFE